MDPGEHFLYVDCDVASILKNYARSIPMFEIGGKNWYDNLYSNNEDKNKTDDLDDLIRTSNVLEKMFKLADSCSDFSEFAKVTNMITFNIVYNIGYLETKFVPDYTYLEDPNSDYHDGYYYDVDEYRHNRKNMRHDEYEIILRFVCIGEHYYCVTCPSLQPLSLLEMMKFIIPRDTEEDTQSIYTYIKEDTEEDVISTWINNIMSICKQIIPQHDNVIDETITYAKLIVHH